MLKLVKRLWKEEEGQGLAEYGLILALIAVICIAALATIGTQINKNLEKVGDSIDDPPA